jgi:hypothetical protein
MKLSQPPPTPYGKKKSSAPKKPKSAQPPLSAAEQSAGERGMMLSKSSFFLPKRGPGGGKVPLVVVPANNSNTANHSSLNRPQGNRATMQFSSEPRRRFIFDKTTGEPYAEWVDDVAVCVHTGQELFRSRRSVMMRRERAEEFGAGEAELDFSSYDPASGTAAALGGGCCDAEAAMMMMQPRLDFSVPKDTVRHPNDFSISTEDMLASGFITLDAFKAPDGAAVRLVDYERFLQEKGQGLGLVCDTDLMKR